MSSAMSLSLQLQGLSSVIDRSTLETTKETLTEQQSSLHTCHTGYNIFLDTVANLDTAEPERRSFVVRSQACQTPTDNSIAATKAESP
jgi:hypothetical protein